MDSVKEKINFLGERLYDQSTPLPERFRALFTLKNLGGHQAIDWIAKTFDDPSALLKHELAFCLGQMQDEHAIPMLVSVLENKRQEAMVRHEAGEALGAIGSSTVLDVLEKYCKDSSPEVAETCQLAAQRILWANDPNKNNSNLTRNPYKSVDPTPPSADVDIEGLRSILLDESKPLFDRYRAMFSLRNSQTSEAALVLAEGLKCSSSALFRHEVAYVLGQMQQPAAIKALRDSLSNLDENCMVRHECAEALGAIAKDECLDVLNDYVNDLEPVVSESCVVALDMCHYENSTEFQYANGLTIK
eukprot:gene20191-22167_t